MYISINPATEEIIKEYTSLDASGLESKLEKAVSIQKGWSEVSCRDKLVLVSKLRKLIDERKEEIVSVIVSEMGKTKAHAEIEVLRLRGICDHAFENLEKISEPEYINYPGAEKPAKVIKRPLGVVFSITPWNVPVATLLRTSLPALLMGNTVLLKPAPNVAGCAEVFESLLIEAGFPEGACQIVLLENELAEKLIADFRVRKVSFVGSTKVGAHLAGIAGKHIKPILLELGGSDPFIVLEDADIEKAAMEAAAARCSNAGQICCSSKRIIVEASVYDTFKELFLAHMKKKKCGDPLDPNTDFGPIARKDLYHALIEQVDRARKSGVTVLLDGGPKEGKGYFFSAMVLEEDVDNAFSRDEEFFGPVANLYKANDQDHALTIANSSRYGLGSAIYTSSPEKAEKFARYLENGFVCINKPAGLNPFLPFGGVKDSGFGKDCGDEGYYEFINKKIVY